MYYRKHLQQVALGLVQWMDGSLTLYDGREKCYGLSDLVSDKEAAQRIIEKDVEYFDNQVCCTPQALPAVLFCNNLTTTRCITGS